jgi:hypothetical protein
MFSAIFIACCVSELVGVAILTCEIPDAVCKALGARLCAARKTVVALGSTVAFTDRLKKIHQNLNSVDLCKPITKYSVQVDSPASTPEVMGNAFRVAEAERPGVRHRGDSGAPVGEGDLQAWGPIVNVHVNYKDNHKLLETVNTRAIQ